MVPPGALPAFRAGRRRDLRVLDDALEVILQTGVREVQEVAVQAADRALHLEPTMRVGAARRRVADAHEPEPPFRIPCVPDPPAQVERGPVHRESFHGRQPVDERAADGRREFRRQRLIRVET